MTTSSAGGLLCGYKPVVLAGSKEPLKICHIHSYHWQALKGFRLCLIYRLTSKQVDVFLQWHLIIFQIFLHLIFYILFNFLCILTYCVDIISSAPEMSIAILILQIYISIEYHQKNSFFSNIPLFPIHCTSVVYPQTYEHNLAYTLLLLFLHLFFYIIHSICDLYLLLFACI